MGFPHCNAADRIQSSIFNRGVHMPGDLDRDYNQSAEELQKEEQRKRDETGTSDGSGFTGGTQEKKRPGTEDAQRRSDTGTGL
jgi:hypothetical protein